MELIAWTEPQQGASYDELLAVARAAEEHGLDGFFRADHLLRIDRLPGDGLPGPSDAWIVLAGLARETSRIRLGTLVSPATFRHPGLLAIAVANVDAMSGGRVELGLGAGWYPGEHEATGIPFPEQRVRFELLEEQLRILRGLWETPVGRTFGFEGRHYVVRDSPALPKPVQSPRPPIILGGGGTRRTPTLVARYADEYNVVFGELDVFRDRVALVREACEREGRDPAGLKLSIALAIALGETEAEVSRRDEMIAGAGHALRGTPDEVADQLLAYRDAGAERAYLQFLDLADAPDAIALAGRALRPLLV